MKRPLRRTNSIRRLNVTLLSVAFAVSIVLGRLVQLQGVDASHYRTISEQQRVATQAIPAVRGEIVSSDGSVLAMTMRTATVYADPPLMKSTRFGAVAAKLAGPLHMEPAAIVHLLRNPSSPDYVKLKESVKASTANAISKLGLPGIALTPTYQRAYPGGSLAASLLGFVHTDPASGVMTGVDGIEQAYNSLLQGRGGRVVYEQGTNGQPIPGTESTVREAVPSGDLRLTIQSDIQWKAEQECALQVAKTNARNCTVVVMQPSTGKILALAQYPTFNPVAPASLWAARDIAVQNMFAPGSTAKVITAAAAFQYARMTPDTSFVVPDAMKWHGAMYHDAEAHQTQRYTIAGIIAHSLNDGMIQVAGRVRPADQYHMFRALGIGSLSGVNLPGESVGLITRPGLWTGGATNTRYQLSFGQSVGVTALQMASVYATIANGGVRVTPTVVAGHTKSDGEYVQSARPHSRRVMSRHTAAELMRMLEQVPLVYKQAGAPWGIIPGYTVAAKTGTAQEPRHTYGSSFIGIAPASSKGLVVAVNLQDPRKGSYFGIDVAGPVFNAVMKFALASMKIPPSGAHVRGVPLTVP
ncbi:MAG: penicillin-binding protein 2 [Nocardiopsaceae bacterium]|jgi:cell division protein FtsI (penicillin-binding protein 3)|nr:penicillin-binding protein 2 [Nocardiopsaceae bacterium]